MFSTGTWKRAEIKIRNATPPINTENIFADFL
jgi:hypothetical protein